MNIQVDPSRSNLASAMLNSKIRPRAGVGYGVKIFLPSYPSYVTRSPGSEEQVFPLRQGLLVQPVFEPGIFRTVISRFANQLSCELQLAGANFDLPIAKSM